MPLRALRSNSPGKRRRDQTEAYGGVGLRERERRRLPGEYDLDLDRDRDRDRLREERDLLRLLKGRAHELPERRPQFLGSASRVGFFPLPGSQGSAPPRPTWTASENRIAIESKSESVISSRSQMILKIVN